MSPWMTPGRITVLRIWEQIRVTRSAFRNTKSSKYWSESVPDAHCTASVIIRMRTFKIHVKVTLRWINQSLAWCREDHAFPRMSLSLSLCSVSIDFFSRRRNMSTRYQGGISKKYVPLDALRFRLLFRFCFRVSLRQLCTFAWKKKEKMQKVGHIAAARENVCNRTLYS